MALADLRLAFLTFAQRWDGASLTATVLVLPSGDPTQPLITGTPAFAGAALRLRAAIVPSLDTLPALDDATTATRALRLNPPLNALELFGDLKTKFAPLDTSGGNPGGIAFDDRVRKALPDSYTALLPPGASRDPNVATAEDFGCTLRGQRPPGIDPGPRTTSWGEVISHALRNPFLADALGLRYEFTLQDSDTQAFADGGWLYVRLDPADPYFAPWDTTLHDAVKSYAARIPALTAATPPRQLFSAVLFPVANPKAAPVTPDESEIDAAIIEAEIYDDGFAEMMHARQPDSLDAHVGDGKVTANAATDAGIQIGWDDEQVLRWQNRQIAISSAQKSGVVPLIEAPLGVLGYRVDVRVPAADEAPSDKNTGWQSLMSAQGTVPDALKDKIIAFSGELTIEPTPTSPKNVRDFWLPLYFAQWRGTPLGTRDDTPHLLAGGTAARDSNAVTLRGSNFEGVGNAIRLAYGTTYEFRTRLADLTGGGPRVDDTPINEAIAERTRVTFSRWVPPKGLRIDTVSDAPHAAPYVDRLSVIRPLMGYPEALFTRRYGSDAKIAAATTDAFLAQLGMTPDGTPPPAPPPKNTVTSIGVPDPDVVSLEIIVEVRALAHDRANDVSADGSFIEMYRTNREVPPLVPIPVNPGQPIDLQAIVKDDPFTLQLQYLDIDDIAAPRVIPGAGPLPLPRSRDVRLRITPLAANPAGIDEYFGTFPGGTNRVPVTRGTTANLLVRAPALSEPTPLFAALPDARPNVQALFFQPHTDGDKTAALMQDLAAQLELDHDGMTLRGRPGERVAFGTTGFKNTIAPDGGSITFASATEIFRHWMVAVQWELARDWTWDGLAGDMVQVNLVPASGLAPATVGTITVPRIASAQAIGQAPDRSRVRLVFFHAIDPAVVDPRDGFTNRDAYQLSAAIPSEAPAPITLTSDMLPLRLPVATIPAGIPKLVSAGYALSAYTPAVDYSSTAARHRQLWLEVAEKPADGDRFFARILAYAPDPLLYNDPILRLQQPGEDPPLKLDPELIRAITPGQPADADGLEAMLELHASPDDPLKFLLPLPDGIDENDPRLFGMWTYELRYGHKDPWSLAHARYSRPLRVTGVQHPAPQLPLVASWQLVAGFVPGPPPPLPGDILGDDLAREELALAKRRARVSVIGRATWQIVAMAPYATPVLADGSRAGNGIPLTTIGFLLYAQAMQADGSGYRNVLLRHQGATPVDPRDTAAGFVYDYGRAVFAQSDIERDLAAAGLPADAPLSSLAVEFYPPGGLGVEGGNPQFLAGPRQRFEATSPSFDPFDPPNFGARRIVRTSALTKVEPYC